jgi:hypothetical protein
MVGGMITPLVGSVVVNDRDVGRSCWCPTEADPPLVVHPDAVLTGSVATELFQPIPRRDPEIHEGLGCIQHHEFAQRHSLELGVELANSLAPPDPFRVCVGERLQHFPSVTDGVINV